jgi:hypothetical protein
MNEDESKAWQVAEFFASAIDAFLQDFLEAVSEGDVHKLAVSCNRIAQLSSCMKQYFHGAAMECAESEGIADACNVAAETVALMVTKRLAVIHEDTEYSAEELTDPNGPATLRQPN